MKTKIIFTLLFLLPGICSFSQELLLKQKIGNRTWLMDKNYEQTLKPTLIDLGYNVINSSIDTSKIYSMARVIISPQNYNKLNGNNNDWFIFTKLTSYGKIAAVAFMFKDEVGVDINEFSKLSDQIKKVGQWNLQFTKEVNDLFYLQLSIPATNWRRKMSN